MAKNSLRAKNSSHVNQALGSFLRCHIVILHVIRLPLRNCTFLNRDMISNSTLVFFIDVNIILACPSSYPLVIIDFQEIVMLQSSTTEPLTNNSTLNKFNRKTLHGNFF